jgi:hypothetical protein
MLRCVELVWTDILEERIITIFRVEKSASNQHEQVAARRFFCPEDGGDMFLWNISSHKIYMEPHPKDGILKFLLQ